MNKTVLNICVIILTLSIVVPLTWNLIDKDMLPVNNHPENDEYTLERALAEETQKHNDLRDSIIAWALAAVAVVGVVIVIPGILIQDHANKHIKEIIEKSNNELNNVKEFAKKAKGEIDEFKKTIFNNIQEDVSKKIQNTVIKVPTLPDVDFYYQQERLTDDNEVFGSLLKYYQESGDSVGVLLVLEKLSTNVAYILKRRQIYHYIAYIYNDETLENSLDYSKANHYYNLYLDNDPQRKSDSIYIVLNDLAYTEIKLAEKARSQKDKAELLSKARKHLEESISIMSDRRINWSNPYKNLGWCCGKIAMRSESKTDKISLFIKALGVYQIAFSRSTSDIELVNERYQETLKDFVSSLK